MNWVFPAWLFLLVVPLALMVWAVLVRRRLGRRRFVSLILRSFALAALVAAIARPRLVDTVEDLGLVFVLDVSKSVPVEARDDGLRWALSEMAKGKGNDRAALVVFGSNPAVEIPFSAPPKEPGSDSEAGPLLELESRVDLQETDIAEALALARSLVPEELAARVVLISDGNATRGETDLAIRELGSSGVSVDVRPLHYVHDDEVMVQSLEASPRTHVDEPLELVLVVRALGEGAATAQVFEDGRPVSEPVRLRVRSGDQAYRFVVAPPEPGFHTYQVRLNPDRDGNRRNNVGRCGVVVQGRSSVAVVSSSDHDQRLTGVFRKSGLDVAHVSASNLPRHPADWIGRGAVVLDDLPAWDMDREQMLALAVAVKDLGMGLLVVGGPTSFAPGGYRGTPLEPVFPVRLDVLNEKLTPKGALVVVLHSVEFDQGNTWAERICETALKSLSPRDEMGIVYFDPSQGERWLFNLGPVGDGAAQKQLIRNVTVGDMPSFHKCFLLALKSLARSRASVKHVVVISDGDPQAPSPQVLQTLKTMKVTVSGVAVAPHGLNVLEDLATCGGGRYIQLDRSSADLARIPRFIVREASRIRRPSVEEKPFTPLVSLPGSILIRGIDSGFPRLLGHVVTSARAEADTVLLADEKRGDPLLATWNFGLGRVTAFTSDATSRWSKEWLSWDGFTRFWTRQIRAVLPASEGSGFPLRATWSGSRLDLEMEAEDGQGRPLTALEPRVALLREGGASRDISLVQSEPGRYVASVAVVEPGDYLARARYDVEGKRRVSLAAASLSFGPEDRSLRSADDKLAYWASLAGGIDLSSGGDPWRHDMVSVRSRRELWRDLLVAGLLLMLLDVGTRRIQLGRTPRAVRSAPSAASPRRARESRAPPLPEAEPEAEPSKDEVVTDPAATEEQRMRALKSAKRRARRRQEWQ